MPYYYDLGDFLRDKKKKTFYFISHIYFFIFSFSFFAENYFSALLLTLITNRHEYDDRSKVYEKKKIIANIFNLEKEKKLK